VKGVPDESFDPEDACKKLYNGMKGLGTDENAVVDVIGSHNNAQRQIIKEKYKTMYGKELVPQLADELGGSFLKVILALMQDPEEYIVEGVHKAIEGLGTDETALIGLLCGRSNDEMKEMSAAYKAKYGKDMEEDVSDELSGDLKKFMVSLMSGGRDESEEIDFDLVKKDAQDLFENGEGALGTREEVFNSIFNLRSPKHLREVFDAYSDLSDGSSMEDAIESEFSGTLKTAYLSLIKATRNMVVYNAERLRDALKGAGTDDDALIQLLVTRSEIDLEDIAEYYLIKYEQSLAEAVAGDTSGDYCAILLKIIGQPPSD
jgi:hypothetical protein